MKSQPPKLNPVVRLAAAGMLLVWLTVVAHCSVECGAGDSDSCSKAEHSHPVAAPGTSSHDSDQHGSHDDSFCVSLHSICLLSSSPALAKPDFGAAWPLDFVSDAWPITMTLPETSVSRQPPDCNWVFTPVVCLGPAFHSLAPPVLV
jgi:hypothetical protein